MVDTMLLTNPATVAVIAAVLLLLAVLGHVLVTLLSRRPGLKFAGTSISHSSMGTSRTRPRLTSSHTLSQKLLQKGHAHSLSRSGMSHVTPRHFQIPPEMQEEATHKVAVTGATGRTGVLLVKKLVDHPDLVPVPIIRPKGKRDAAEVFSKKNNVDKDIIKVVENQESNLEGLMEAFAGCKTLVVCTSAVPKPKTWSLVKMLGAKLLPGSQKLGIKPQLKFGWKGDQIPAIVDCQGQKAQIDAAIAAGIEHIVILGSMGGTDPDNFLNTIGRQEDGLGGDILKWKREAEKYLVMQEDRVAWTIVHAGGLVSFKREDKYRVLLTGVDDTLIAGADNRSLERDMVADVLVAAVLDSRLRGKSFDIASRIFDKDTDTALSTNVMHRLDDYITSGASCQY